MAIIVNTDDHKKSGTHWTAIYIDNRGVGTYFDSFGLPPRDPKILERLRLNCSVWKWNTHQVQSEESDVCGEFSLLFLYHMFSGGTLISFNELFTKNLTKNDYVAKSFYSRLVMYLKRDKKSVETMYHDYLRALTQNCTPRLK